MEYTHDREIIKVSSFSEKEKISEDTELYKNIDGESAILARNSFALDRFSNEVNKSEEKLVVLAAKPSENIEEESSDPKRNYFENDSVFDELEDEEEDVLTRSESEERINLSLMIVANAISLILMAVMVRLFITLPTNKITYVQPKLSKISVQGFPIPQIGIVTPLGSILTVSFYQDFDLTFDKFPNPGYNGFGQIFPYYDAKEASLIFLYSIDNKKAVIYDIVEGKQ